VRNRDIIKKIRLFSDAGAISYRIVKKQIFYLFTVRLAGGKSDR